MYKAYISGALTNVENLSQCQDFYENIGLLCKDIGLHAYIPHIHTDPVKNYDISPTKVFETDKYQVSISDLVIAYLGTPSFGVGMELAYAEINKIPIILIYEESKRVSRFPRGIPTVIAEVKFKDYQEALGKLKDILLNWKTKNESFISS